jgi:hypothetical protein
MAVVVVATLSAVVGSGLRSEPCRDRIKWPFGALLPTLAVLHVDNRWGCFPLASMLECTDACSDQALASTTAQTLAVGGTALEFHDSATC